jgi:hypothetical protein
MAMKYLKVYYDWSEVTKTLSDAEKGRLITAMVEHAKGNKSPELSGTERHLFPMFQAQIDRDNESYEKVSRIRAEVGLKGGQASASKAKQKQAKTSNCLQDQEKEEEKDKRKLFSPDSKPYQCAKYLAAQIQERLPQGKPADEKQLQSWADSFDKVNRIDGYDWQTIGEVLTFSQTDEFWKKNILSGATFRKQFIKLYAKLPEGQREQAPRKPIKGKVVDIADEDGNVYKKFVRESD